jgi:Fe-S-cluster containining protein
MNGGEFLEHIARIRRERGIKRVGKCKMCGRCCEGPVKVYTIKNDTIEFKDYSGIEKICKAFDNKKRICKSHDRRPMSCAEYPYLPENRLKGCGFYFRKI